MQYLQTVQALEAAAAPQDGLLGMGSSPQSDACHEQFDQAVGHFIEQLLPIVEETDCAALTGLMLESEQRFGGSHCARWMLVAVQRHALPLIPHVPPVQAAALLQHYDRLYPPRLRLPVQKAIGKALKAQAHK